MLVRKLRHKVDNLEKRLKRLEDLEGLQAINLCKRDKRMIVAVNSLMSLFQEELDKDSDQNAKSSFLLCQVIVL